MGLSRLRETACCFATCDRNCLSALEIGLPLPARLARCSLVSFGLKRLGIRAELSPGERQDSHNTVRCLARPDEAARPLCSRGPFFLIFGIGLSDPARLVLVTAPRSSGFAGAGRILPQCEIYPSRHSPIESHSAELCGVLPQPRSQIALGRKALSAAHSIQIKGIASISPDFCCGVATAISETPQCLLIEVASGRRATDHCCIATKWRWGA